MIGLCAVISILGVCALVAWPDIENREFGSSAIGAIVWAVVLFVVFGLTMGVVSMFLKDFVVPIMYLRRIRVLEAWKVFGGSLLSDNAPTFLLYILVRFAIDVVVAFLALGITCFTCCLAAIPFVGSVILLPLTVFVQAYPLYFIEQFGPDWRVFPLEKSPPSTGPSTPFSGATG